MKTTEEITEQDIVYIQKYANEGKSDQWIMKKLNIKLHIVAKHTTDYWKNKMDKKPKE